MDQFLLSSHNLDDIQIMLQWCVQHMKDGIDAAHIHQHAQ